MLGWEFPRLMTAVEGGVKAVNIAQMRRRKMETAIMFILCPMFILVGASFLRLEALRKKLDAIENQLHPE